jgi:hypothetical protein
MIILRLTALYFSLITCINPSSIFTPPFLSIPPKLNVIRYRHVLANCGTLFSPEPDVAVPHPRLGVRPVLRSFFIKLFHSKNVNELLNNRNEQEFENQPMRTRLASITRDSQSPDELQPLPSIISLRHSPHGTGTSPTHHGKPFA